MKKTKCLIVDDEAVAQRIILNYLSELPDFEVIDTCLNAVSALPILQTQAIDLLFLDIEMPRIKGLSLLQMLSAPPAVIITTAHREFALQGFEVEAVDYLLKPISFERFLKAIARYQRLKRPDARELRPVSGPAFIYIKSERRTIKLREDEILYLEGMSNYVLVHCEEGRHITYKSLQGMLDELGRDFLRVHKSFVINRRHIRAFSREFVQLGDRELPIGKAYKAVIDQF